MAKEAAVLAWEGVCVCVRQPPRNPACQLRLFCWLVVLNTITWRSAKCVCVCVCVCVRVSECVNGWMKENYFWILGVPNLSHSFPLCVCVCVLDLRRCFFWLSLCEGVCDITQRFPWLLGGLFCHSGKESESEREGDGSKEVEKKERKKDKKREKEHERNPKTGSRGRQTRRAGARSQTGTETMSCLCWRKIKVASCIASGVVCQPLNSASLCFECCARI